MSKKLIALLLSAFVTVAWTRLATGQESSLDPGADETPSPTSPVELVASDDTAGVDVAWQQEVMIPERLATAEEAGLPPITGDGLESTDCSPTPQATAVARGPDTDDTIIYGSIYFHQPSPFRMTYQGLGFCRFQTDTSKTCDAGRPEAHVIAGSGGEWIGIHGDTDNCASDCGVDHIHSVSQCGPSLQCDSYGSFHYEVNTSNVSSTQKWEICGDDCSVTSGEGDEIDGWNNRDNIFAGNGSDVVDGWGGSDCLWGDNGNDTMQGHDCVVTETEWLMGGNWDDTLYGYKPADENGGTGCPRYMTGGGGWDTIRGGPGNDQIFGDDQDDVLGGNNGSDVCNGGSGDHDTCDAAPSCNTRTACEP